MYYLVYSSTSIRSLTQEELAAILKSSHLNNSKAGITGMLLYSQGRFMQVLEGEQKKVHDLYLHIVKNPLHFNHQVLLEGRLTKRNFQDWTMGFKQLSEEEFTLLSNYENIDMFFEHTSITDNSHPALIFLKLFYQKNASDHLQYL